ncbi:MAG: FMN-binding negative transcriptional regulator [Proteobacteria bacterium]|nr:FMN-binding negative transcriptional regulator [Pseudomonadota bacterium]
MHPAGIFQVAERAPLVARLRAQPFVTLAAAPDGRPRVAHAPVVARETGGGLALDFHLARGNALAPFLAGGFRAVAVSLGPDAYVSPDWYGAPDQVPTWNYLAVEAEGPVAAMDEAGLADLLDRLSAQEEAKLAPKPPWTRGKMGPGRFAALLRGIVGATLTVERLEGTFKFSQNKAPEQRAGVAAALGGHPMGALVSATIPPAG